MAMHLNGERHGANATNTAHVVACEENGARGALLAVLGLAT